MKYIIVPIFLFIWCLLVYVFQTLAVMVMFLYQFEIKREWFKYNPDDLSTKNKYKDYETVFHWYIHALKELKEKE